MAAAVVATAALLVPTAGAQSVPSAPAELKGVTVVSGGRPARIPVHLRRPTTIANPLVDGHLEIRGRGRFVGFVLAKDGRDGYEQVVLGGRLPTSAGSRAFVVDVGFFADGLSKAAVELDPGDYDLYLIPGRGQAEVELRFEGLTGRAELHPDAPVAATTKAMAPLDTGLETGLYARSATGEIMDDGLIFQAAWFQNDAHVATNYDACVWKGPAREPWAMLPSCGDSFVYEPEGGRASHGTIDYGNGVGDNFRLHYGAWIMSEIAARGGDFGQSFDLQTASAIKSLDSLALWLSF